MRLLACASPAGLIPRAGSEPLKGSGTSPPRTEGVDSLRAAQPQGSVASPPGRGPAPGVHVPNGAWTMYKRRNVTQTTRRQSNGPDLAQAITGWLIMSLGLLVTLIMRSQGGTQGSRSA